MLKQISLNLVSICDIIIENQIQSNTLNANEYSKNGKKYKLTNSGHFIRVQGESKHLIISTDYQHFKDNLSIISSYYILKNHGTILQDFRDLCLAIIFVSREIELNKWYESTSKILTLEDSLFDPTPLEEEALNYISNISEDDRNKYIKLGCHILTATKINFFQTDHNVSSPILEGFALRKLIVETCDEEGLTSTDVYNSLRAFSHWCSIKGIFYKLNIPGLNIDNALIHNFKSFPNLPNWIKDTTKGRYPAGCSKCSLIKKSLYLLSTSIYGNLLTFPNKLDIEMFLELCKNIESDPLRYHIRSGSLGLSINSPLELNQIFKNSDSWIEWISCILHAIGNYRLRQDNNNLVISNKILKLNRIKDKPDYRNTLKLVDTISTFDRMGDYFDDDKIIEMLGGKSKNCLADKVNKYI